MAAPLDFYFDYSSPYGYFAAAQVDAVAARHGRSVTWHPILLGAVFKITGQRPLPSIPLKGDYVRRDLERYATLLNLPFRFPTRFPLASTAACRAFYHISDTDPEVAKRFARAVYGAFFVDDRDISSPEVVVAIAREAAAHSDDLSARLNDESTKARLRQEVDAAIERKVFGSPFVFVDGEPFWGADRLDQVERWLATGGW